jgi:hypothetical protein
MAFDSVMPNLASKKIIIQPYNKNALINHRKINWILTGIWGEAISSWGDCTLSSAVISCHKVR